MDDFERGVAFAASLVMRCHGDPVIAADVFRQGGFADLDCTDLDEYDKAPLREVNKERGMKLKGLEPGPEVARYWADEAKP